MERMGHVINTLVIFTLSLSLQIISSSGQYQIFRQEPEDHVANLGQTVFLNCEVENLLGKVTWMRDIWGLGLEKELPSYPRYKLSGDLDRGDYTLMISNTQLEDDAEFQCQVLATATTGVLLSKKSKVTVRIPPSDPVIDGAPKVEVVAGEPYNLTCTAANGKPAPTISWYVGRTPIHSNFSHYEVHTQADGKRQNATSWLTITPRKSDQDKSYYCEVANEATVNPKVKNVSLEVLYKPEVSMWLSPPDSTVKEGSSVKFTCEALGNPNTMEWKWFRGTEELVEQTSSVLVQRVDRDWHAGKVECQATNIVGSSRQSVTLNVEYAPYFTGAAEHVAADVGDDVEMTCAVQGNPEPGVFWTRQGSEKILSSRRRLPLYGVEDKHFGVFLCHASVLGFQEITMPVHLLKKGPPAILSPQAQASRFGDTGVVECLSRSVPKPQVIVWTKDGQPINFDELQRYQNREEDLPNGKRSIVEITSVQDGDYGHYNCTVENSYGSDAVSIEFFKKEVIPLEYIVAGVLTGILIIIIIAVVLVIKKRKKSSSSSDTDSNTSESSISKRKLDGPPGIKVEYPHGAYGNPSIVDAWKAEADKNIYGPTAEYDELHYVPPVVKDPWLPTAGYGSHYGGFGPGYAKSDYGTYPGPASNRNIYEPSHYGSQSIYGGPAYSDYGIYGTYGRHPHPPRSDFPHPPRSDFIPASELGRPSTAMSNRLSTNV